MAWTPTKRCFPQINVCMARTCVLDSDGTTHISSTSTYLTPAVVSLGITPVIEAGTEIKEKDGCGETFIDVISNPSLTRYDVDLDFWSTDPTLLKHFLQQGAVLTAGSGAEGFGFPKPGTLSGQLSFEFWQKIINANNLDPDFPYARWGLPFLKNVVLQKRDVNNQGVSHSVFKAEAYSNENWFNGPGDDWDVDTSYPVLYLPVASIPAATCVPTAIAS